MTRPQTVETDAGTAGHIRQVAARWLTERDAGILSPAQADEMTRWLDSDVRHRAAFERMETVWAQMGAEPIEDALERQRHKGRQRFMQMAGAAMAACLALVIAAAAYDVPTRLEADYIAATGETRQIRLEDGSVLHLNSQAAVAVDYSADQRKVRLLKGEAAFTVAKDASRPFRVEAGKGSTTALGTEFIVRTDKGQHQVFVTEHSVRVALGTQQVTIAEGEGVDYGAQGLSPAYRLEVSDASAWMRGRLVFADRPMADVVRELNRFHKGRILITSDALAQQRFSGSFRTDDTQAALGAIETALNIRATRLPGGLVLLHL
ncbi:MAG: FecR family protein [Asticcacaulis sp.]